MNSGRDSNGRCCDERGERHGYGAAHLMGTTPHDGEVADKIRAGPRPSLGMKKASRRGWLRSRGACGKSGTATACGVARAYRVTVTHVSSTRRRTPQIASIERQSHGAAGTHARSGVSLRTRKARMIAGLGRKDVVGRGLHRRSHSTWNVLRPGGRSGRLLGARRAGGGEATCRSSSMDTPHDVARVYRPRLPLLSSNCTYGVALDVVRCHSGAASPCPRRTFGPSGHWLQGGVDGMDRVNSTG